MHTYEEPNIGNAHFEQLAKLLIADRPFDSFVFNIVTEKNYEGTLDSLENKKVISSNAKRVYEYYFKLSEAVEYLDSLAEAGINQERDKFGKSNISIRKKKKRINELIPFLHRIKTQISERIKDYDWTELENLTLIKLPAWVASDVFLVSKITLDFQKELKMQVESRNIVSGDDTVKLWSKVLIKGEYVNTFLKDSTPFDTPLSIEEIRAAQLFMLYHQIHSKIATYTHLFKDELNFTLANVIENKSVKEVIPKPKIDDKIRDVVYGILVTHVEAGSQEALKDFFALRNVENKIRFIGEKQELLSIFRLLYRNHLITQIPKQISEAIVQSFITPNSNRGEKLFAESVSKYLTRKSIPMPKKLLPEIEKLMKSKKWLW